MTTARRFVLLDRDGTLNVERDYLADPALVELYPGVGAALRRLRTLGFGLAVLTNQSGLARGYFDAATLESIHDRLRLLLAREDVVLDGIFVCPHGPKDGCHCRKPRPGLAEQAAARLHFDPAESIVVGDKLSDILLAQAIGAVGILVRTGHGMDHVVKSEGIAAAIVDDLAGAVDWIEGSLAADARREERR